MACIRLYVIVVHECVNDNFGTNMLIEFKSCIMNFNA